MQLPATDSPAYVPSLDAIRGIAILLVMGLHYGPIGFGWIGVQIFFVLSGFLITAILLKEREKALGAYMRRFYVRRALRIFPLYYGFLLLCTVVYWGTGYLRTMEAYWPYLYTYLFNIRSLFGISKIDALHHDPFYHLWSLSVEEQFYLLWPWLVFGLSPKHFRLCLCCIVAGTPLLRWLVTEWCLTAGYGKEFTRVFVYYFTPCQVDAFAWGAMLAAFPRPSARAARIIFWLVFALTVTAGYANHVALRIQGSDDDVLAFGFPLHMFENLQYVWGYSLLDILGAALIALFLARPEPRPSFGWKALIRIGKVSYGMYVLHVALLIPFRIWVTDPDMDPVLFVASYLLFVVVAWAVAEVSFKYLERPFLQLKDKLAA